jgi:hypothetical protein
MADYDKVLVQIIRDANNDPAKMREIVYEVARLALWRQANLQTPALSYGEMRHQLAKLEEAITRAEASAAAEQGEAAPVTNGDGSPINWEREDARFPLEGARRHEPSKRAPPGSRELVLVPQRVDCSTYLVNPDDFVSPDIPYRLASESVRGLYQGLHSFRNMRRLEASLRKARALRLRFSQSLASRRQRFNQAIVRSTIQRLGNGTNPLARSERLTISVLRLGETLASAVWKIDPA